MKVNVLCLAALVSSVGAFAQTAPATKPSSTPTFTAVIRERTNVTQWFAATPTSETYAHQDSLLRLSLTQRIRQWDYQLELGQSAELSLPTDAVSAVSAQGQLGLGGTYYAANSNNSNPRLPHSVRVFFVTTSRPSMTPCA